MILSIAKLMACLTLLSSKGGVLQSNKMRSPPGAVTTNTCMLGSAFNWLTDVGGTSWT